MINADQCDNVVEVIQNVFKRCVWEWSVLLNVFRHELCKQVFVSRTWVVRHVLHCCRALWRLVFLRSLGDKARAKIYLHDATILGESLDHLVVHVALPPGRKMSSRGVRCDNR